MNAAEALEKLKQGNLSYVNATSNPGDVSLAIRQKTASEGQFPYAVVVACSDSRVVPEAIFSAGIGELFVIRVAGNIVDLPQLASIEYATDHLHTPLVVVLGHTHCGAIAASLSESDHSTGLVGHLIDHIHHAIGEEKNPDIASELNVKYGVQKVTECPSIHTTVVGAVYNIETGSIAWL